MKTIQDVMTRSVVAVEPATPIRDVARLLVAHGISGLPVVDADGGVVGVISEGDLLVKEGGPDAVPHRPLARLFGESRETEEALARVEARTAGDAMTSPAVTIAADQPLNAAAALMVQRGIKRLPVTEGGRLVGIVTRADLMRAFLQSDEELVGTIRREVLLRQLWINPEDFEVTAAQGVVTVRGRVERRSTAEMVARFVRTVPGVVAVEADVAWSIDDGDIEAPAPDLLGPYEP
jgi:CBS domain-containing protein